MVDFDLAISLPSYQLLGLAGLFILTVLSYSKRRWTLPLPPGPRPLPLVGNLFDFPRARAWIDYGKWSKHYGSDILYLRLPLQPVVILNSAQAICDLLNKRSNIYADKPLSVMDELVGWDWHLAIMPYGQRWKHTRRYFHQYFHAGTVHMYRGVQTREVKAYLQRELESAGNSAIHSINHLFSSIILDITYGIQIKDMDDPFISTIKEAVVSFNEITVPGAFLVDIFPFLRHIPSWVPGATFHQYAQRHRPKVYAMRERPFNKTKQDILEGIARPSMTHSLVNMLQKRHGDSSAYAEHEGYAMDAASVAYGAAVETSFSTTCWFILAMAMYPEVQAKAQRELDRVVGPGRLPAHDDYDSLPYVQALMLESFRWVTTLPMGVPHRVLVEDEYKGCRIPKGSIIVPNLWHVPFVGAVLHLFIKITLREICRNAEDYPNPDVFDPDRFLKDGRINPEIRDPSTFIFGFGRRICPGRYFAKEALFLTFASVLSVFNIKPTLDKNGKPVQLGVSAAMPVEGLFLHPERLDCVFEPRSSKAALLIRQSAQ